MTFRFSRSSVGLLLMAVSAISLAQHGADKIAMLKNRYAELSQATRLASYPAVKEWMSKNTAPTFSLRSGDGNLTDLSATLSLMKTEFLILKTVKSHTYKVSNFAIHEDHLSCTVKTKLLAVTKDGSKIEDDSLAVDTWIPIHGAWKLSTVVTTKEKFAANGKIIHSYGIAKGEAFP